MHRGASVVTVRKTFQAIAFTGPAAMLLVLARSDLSLKSAVACMTAALGFSSLGEPENQARSSCESALGLWA